MSGNSSGLSGLWSWLGQLGNWFVSGGRDRDDDDFEVSPENDISSETEPPSPPLTMPSSRPNGLAGDIEAIQQALGRIHDNAWQHIQDQRNVIQQAQRESKQLRKQRDAEQSSLDANQRKLEQLDEDDIDGRIIYTKRHQVHTQKIELYNDIVEAKAEKIKYLRESLGETTSFFDQVRSQLESVQLCATQLDNRYGTPELFTDLTAFARDKCAAFSQTLDAIQANDTRTVEDYNERLSDLIDRLDTVN